eukprot:GHUV01030299.1.p1 GENE.GHUV01030299.1~~GHUV01030299.1.p1  ORF type:complete len:246 (+),score=19.36 GHUV01030299.1:54-791(+)
MIFKRPKQPGFTSRHLFVGNCGPALGFTDEDVRNMFAPFVNGESADRLEVHMPWSGTASHVYVSFASQQEAARAIEQLSGRPCEQAGGRFLMVKYAAVEEPKQVQCTGWSRATVVHAARPHYTRVRSLNRTKCIRMLVLTHSQAVQHLPVAVSSQQAGIPGLQIHTDFVTPIEEAALLKHIDQQPWTHLAKRRVQHYGYKFEYSQRGVDPKQRLGPLPEWVQPLQRRLEVCRVYSHCRQQHVRVW